MFSQFSGEGGILNNVARVSLLSNTHQPESHPVTIKQDVLVTIILSSVWNTQNIFYISGTFRAIKCSQTAKLWWSGRENLFFSLDSLITSCMDFKQFRFLKTRRPLSSLPLWLTGVVSPVNISKLSEINTNKHIPSRQSQGVTIIPLASSAIYQAGEETTIKCRLNVG